MVEGGAPSEDPCVQSFLQYCREELHANTENQPNTEKSRESSEKNRESSEISESFGYFFYSVAGVDEVVNAFELKEVLGKIFEEDLKNGFSLEACRSLIASHDDSFTGNLSYNQFKRCQLFFQYL